MTTVEEFLAGEPLTYRGFDCKKKLKAVYQIGVGVIITDKGTEIGVAETVLDDDAARRTYHNLVRNSGGEA